MMKRARKLFAMHPGEFLREEFMDPLRLSADRLATDLDAPEIAQVIRCKRPITPDLALRLGKYFRTSAEFWMNVQAQYDLRTAAASARLDRIKPLRRSRAIRVSARRSNLQPNATTIKSIKSAMRGEGKRYTSADALIKAIGLPRA
jgi:antitoxin HigA-1